MALVLAASGVQPVVSTVSPLKQESVMNIEYEINVDDWLALNRHLIKSSPLMIRAVRKGQAWWAMGPVVGGALLAAYKRVPLEKSGVILAAIFLILSVPMFFLYPIYFKFHSQRFIRKFYKSEKNKGAVGKHFFSVSDDALTDKTDYNNNTISWKSVDRIESTEDHTFIFTDELTAYIIPRHSILNGKYDEFVNKLMETSGRQKD